MAATKKKPPMTYDEVPGAFWSKSLENVQVHGDEVRFETEKLSFVGHVDGNTPVLLD